MNEHFPGWDQLCPSSMLKGDMLMTPLPYTSEFLRMAEGSQRILRASLVYTCSSNIIVKCTSLLLGTAISLQLPIKLSHIRKTLQLSICIRVIICIRGDQSLAFEGA